MGYEVEAYTYTYLCGSTDGACAGSPDARRGDQKVRIIYYYYEPDDPTIRRFDDHHTIDPTGGQQWTAVVDRSVSKESVRRAACMHVQYARQVRERALLTVRFE